MQEMNNLHQDGETLLYPRMIIRDCCGTEELASTISEESSFTPGEVMGMMRQLCRKMAAAMAEGRSVKLDGLGTFSPSLALRKGRERETTDGSGKRRNAGSIEVGSVNFRADRMMVQEINHRCHLERSPSFNQFIAPTDLVVRTLPATMSSSDKSCARATPPMHWARTAPIKSFLKFMV